MEKERSPSMAKGLFKTGRAGSQGQRNPHPVTGQKKILSQGIKQI